ncbi:class I SAM-dependent methyltransferase [Coraliomargarita akajimensis]|uniref:Methyltransferase type 12 n=1 Tax=Coraliomargarita akajimensis (strain DSM 45221 / IAM 15411 / JCM 23193 / KCTC 12865 / 04OKA010-24) TaxID=583355 RepID=D5EL42_CORAD|nr:class I SAM-dependent methyltransferase [Coraliomargarita akajimensis]ADE53144.1 Methyltransferase type 12 [Coraliomargarita akajimensis DSM 45221]
MDLSYWDKTLQNYAAEIVSVYDLDADCVVTSLIRRLARSGASDSAADLGCGIGQFTQFLSSCYDRVESCDFSSQGLQLTQERCASLQHIHYHQLDLTSDPVPFNPVDLVLCINVLMMPSMDERLRAWRTVSNQVRQSGHLILVVPAVESIMMERHCELGQQLHEGHSCQDSLEATLPEHSTAMDFHQGVYIIDRVRTKHYLKHELIAMLNDHQFNIQQIQPLRYRAAGQTQDLDTWDWLILAQRN